MTIVMMNMQYDDDELQHSPNGVMFAVNRDYKYYLVVPEKVGIGSERYDVRA